MMDSRFNNSWRRVVPDNSLIYPEYDIKIIMSYGVDDIIPMIIDIRHGSYFYAYAYIDGDELILASSSTGIFRFQIGSMFLVPKGELRINNVFYDEIINRIASLGGVGDG